MKLLCCLHLTVLLIVFEASSPNAIDEKPFHLFNEVGAPAAPIIRPDNTTKSRVPDDTLLLQEGPEEFGFDSLDNHLQEHARPISNMVQSANLGNLHPDEVFYADDDLLIIKGGGFEGPVYQEPEPVTKHEEEFSVNEIFGRPPNPHEEYNGNVPTIVRPPPNHPKFAPHQQSSYYPRLSPLALFLPAKMLATGNNQPYYYVPVQYQANPVIPSLLWFLLHQGYPLYTPPRPAVSFIGDTNVNFVNPRPPINPDAELIEIHRAPEKAHKHTNFIRRPVKPRL